MPIAAAKLSLTSKQSGTTATSARRLSLKTQNECEINKVAESVEAIVPVCMQGVEVASICQQKEGTAIIASTCGDMNNDSSSSSNSSRNVKTTGASMSTSTTTTHNNDKKNAIHFVAANMQQQQNEDFGMQQATQKCATNASENKHTPVCNSCTTAATIETINTTSKTPIKDFYRNATLLITGGTGFVGKVLIQKLLRSFEVQKIYMLIRCKDNMSVEQRLEQYFNESVSGKVVTLPLYVFFSFNAATVSIRVQ